MARERKGGSEGREGRKERREGKEGVGVLRERRKRNVYYI